jgi:zinc/manganese transport system ATP-binding protein
MSLNGCDPQVTLGRTAVLEVTDLTVVLGGRVVLDNVTFDLARGSVAGLIGPNGAGKTTLLKAILGFVTAQSGSLKRSASDGRAVAKVGYVPQKIDLDPDMPLRARDLVGLGLDGSRLGFPLPSRKRRTRIDEALEAVGAAQFADKRVGRLSGGEQKRVLIAHAVIRQPDLLLLDEPLANLDLRSEREVVDLVASLARDSGIASLVSTHDVNPLVGAMDKVVYLAAGKSASGRVDEVVTTEVLSALYGHQVDVLRVHGRVVVSAAPGPPPPHVDPVAKHLAEQVPR